MRGLVWEATLAGDGPVERFRAVADASDVGARISMPGGVDEAEVARLCRNADILVLPSRAEAMSMAVLEGMAHALAVVTTRVGAHDEIIRDGDTGVFVPAGDPQALADALARLVLDPALRRRLGQRAREHFVENLSIAAYMHALDGLYETVGRRRKRASEVST
jgi:glycosyltransferase involved in cell wall biosynthesis